MSQLDQAVFSLMMSGLQKHCKPRCLQKTESELSFDQKDCLAKCQEKFVEGYQVSFQRAAERLAADMQKLGGRVDSS